MGDYSRDTFRLTNALHQLLTNEPVGDARQYVGVRLQQGVPLVDADWNELEDIRHMELRAILRFFIGDGAPTASNGFEISENGEANNFSISPGLILFEGLLAVNLNATSYNAQPLVAGLPALTTPGVAERTDVVYLDVWHEEVYGSGGAHTDERLVNEQIGLETALRIVRRWQVRLREGASNLTDLPLPAGHRFLPLALLKRRAGVSAIRDTMIVDLRKRGITLSDHLKVPIYVRRGLEVLDITRFAQMLKALRGTLFQRLKINQLPYQTSAPNAQKKESLLFMALQELMQLAQVGELQALARNLDNADALKFMKELYAGQNAWVDLLAEIGNAANTAQTFITEYRHYLNGNAGLLIKGLKPALDQNDLLSAVIAQETLNLWLTAPANNLPEGSVDALYLSVIPADENLTAGSDYVFTYDIRTDFTSPEANEDFQVQAILPAAFGNVSVSQSLHNFSPPMGQASITVTVTPSGGSATAELDVSVFAVRNATLRSSQPPITLNLNALPPVAAFFYYAGPRVNADGRMEIPQNHLTRVDGRDILFRLKNSSVAENRSYTVTRRIVPNVGDTTGWSPLIDTALPVIHLAPGTQSDVLARVDGPKTPNPAPPVGTTGQIIATAVVSAIDGAPPVDAQTPITVTIPFVVV